MTWTKADQIAYEQRTNLKSDNPWIGTLPVVQKQQVDLPKERRCEVHRDKRRKKTVDGAGHPSYRVAITLKVSDDRARDPDGGGSTILDCLVDAAGRLVAMGPRAKDNDDQGAERAGGG